MRRAPLRASLRHLLRRAVYGFAFSSSVSSFSCVSAVDGLSGGVTSGPPGDQLRGGGVEAPAGCAACVGDGYQGRVLGPAAVLGQRAPGAERAAGRGHLPGLARLFPSGPVASWTASPAQGAAE